MNILLLFLDRKLSLMAPVVFGTEILYHNRSILSIGFIKILQIPDVKVSMFVFPYFILGKEAKPFLRSASVGTLSDIVLLLYCSYAFISKYPVPVRPKRIFLVSPVFLHSRASSIAQRMAWELYGAGRIPSIRANITAASKTFVCSYERAFSRPSA